MILTYYRRRKSQAASRWPQTLRVLAVWGVSVVGALCYVIIVQKSPEAILRAQITHDKAELTKAQQDLHEARVCGTQMKTEIDSKVHILQEALR